MTNRVAVQLRPSVAARFGAFVLERFPFAAAAAAAALDEAGGTDLAGDAAIRRVRAHMPGALRRALTTPPADLPDPTPPGAASARGAAAVGELTDAFQRFPRR